MTRLFLSLALLFTSSGSYTQIAYDGTFGKGLNFKANDGSFGLKLAFRIQPRWDYLYDVETTQFQQQAWVARSRIKLDGFMINENLRYKMEFDVVGGYVRDALIKYRFAPHSDIWFGQGKLPGNRERVVSSGNLQFVNRSICNDMYNIDRDVGIQFHHFFKFGKNFIVRDMYALSTGNGILNKRFKPKPSLTAKIEVLPFGNFIKKGDYVGADIEREQNFKMAIAFSVDYNMAAYKSNSHIGQDLNTTRDLLTYGADMLFKYKGWSILTEWGMRTAPNQSELVYGNASDANTATAANYTVHGLNLQGGYVFQSNWEIALRYSFTDPNELTTNSGQRVSFYNDITDHTICLSKYIVGHKLKIQGDVTYRVIENKNDLIQARLQMELEI
jgi:hypothetical protein